jgi:hypothetical protein
MCYYPPVTQKRQINPQIEQRPDAWERFVMAVGYAVKTPAMHRETKKQRPANKGRVRKGKGRA